MPVDPRAAMQALASTVIACLVASVITGCGERPRVRAIPPAAFATAEFPDVPVPIGFVPSPIHDQLAVTMAGGAIRRYAAVFEAADADNAMQPVEIIAWYADRLPELGWSNPQVTGHTARTWSRQRSDGRTELLRLGAGREGRRPIIRLLLTPEAPAPSR